MTELTTAEAVRQIRAIEDRNRRAAEAERSTPVAGPRVLVIWCGNCGRVHAEAIDVTTGSIRWRCQRCREWQTWSPLDIGGQRS